MPGFCGDDERKGYEYVQRLQQAVGRGPRKVRWHGAYLSLRTLTDDIRTLRDVEFTVKERANSARDFQGCDHSYTEESLIAWRAVLCEMLTTLEVCSFRFNHRACSSSTSIISGRHEVRQCHRPRGQRGIRTSSRNGVLFCLSLLILLLTVRGLQAGLVSFVSGMFRILELTWT